MVCYLLGLRPSIPCSSIVLLRQYYCKGTKTRSRRCVLRGCPCSNIVVVIQYYRKGTPKQTADHRFPCLASAVSRGCPCNSSVLVIHYSCTGTHKIHPRCCVLCGCPCNSIVLVIHYYDYCKGTKSSSSAFFIFVFPTQVRNFVFRRRQNSEPVSGRFLLYLLHILVCEYKSTQCWVYGVYNACASNKPRINYIQ